MSVAHIALKPGYEISRVIRGGWQLAGGHGSIDRASAIADLGAFYDAGITTFDCADIYTGVEDLIGDFRQNYANAHGADALSRLRVHTKLVPDLNMLSSVDRNYIRDIVHRSLKRLRCDRLDLVQFHWWDYAVPGYLDAAAWLDEMRSEGKVDLVGGTNFDTAHMLELIANGFPLATMQVQYSLLDARPEASMAAACLRHGVHLLCYGSVAGGFLSNAWLGKTDPKPPYENRSLTKYKLIIDDFGGWDLFQKLLTVLHRIAQRHGSDIATIASRIMLDQPAVAAVIVGARDQSHIASNVAITSIELSEQDLSDVGAVLKQRKAQQGDVYALERERDGRHGSIMRYNQNKEAS